MNKLRFLPFLLTVFLSNTSNSEMVCANDFDGIEGLSQNEISSCLTSDSGSFVCPLQMLQCVERPPIIRTEECLEEVVTTPTGTEGETTTETKYSCPLLTDGTLHDTKTSCDSICEIEEPPTDTSLVCPSGEEHPCGVIDGISFCSANPCADNESEDVTTVEELVTESQPPSALDENGECSGGLTVFPGIQTGCRRAGTQTRWDNCCNNGDKIIEDSFSNPIDNNVSAYDTVAGIVDGVLGTDIQDTTGTVEDVVQAWPGYELTDFAVTGANWLVSPCARDSVSSSLIASNFCVKIGTKCTEKWSLLGKSWCVQQAEVHCCFNSLMAKTVHIQGRSQLQGMGWGDKYNPNCSGFTIEQFQALDFSKFDFTEYENEIRSRSQDEIEQITQQLASDVSEEYSE